MHNRKYHPVSQIIADARFPESGTTPTDRIQTEDVGMRNLFGEGPSSSTWKTPSATSLGAGTSEAGSDSGARTCSAALTSSVAVTFGAKHHLRSDRRGRFASRR
eukprot:gnl/TRDRNA2_/TRDRNA2_85264_c0_seq1.p2 gnl/TRDRNA2_/TRDRNA2_85264_c0~~gnl/TRDRNA2_/TRDRNA2_85264_c0_seq1.p2  ORF type:complete len:104 (-),score=6.19 gnl/TRDRNA2_/TRDRNA2_85264_c0_seq1:36-347(-)